MKYAKSRKLNLGKYDKEKRYEMVTIEVSDCDSQKEADDALDKWEQDEIKNIK